MIIYKEELANKLGITPKTLRLWCLKHIEELRPLGYTDKKFVNLCVQQHIEEHYKPAKIKKNVEYFAKSKIAKYLGLSSKTVKRLIENPETIEALLQAGYNRKSKKLTRKQLDIFNKDEQYFRNENIEKLSQK